MTGIPLALAIIGTVLVLAAAVIVAVVSRRPLTRVAEPRCNTRALGATPSHRELPGRPPAAGTARLVYRITDCPAAHQGARGNERN